MYKLTNSETIIGLPDNACIPNDPRNSDYKEYLEWIDEGNTPEAWKTPEEIVIWEAEQAAEAARKAAKAQAYIDNLPGWSQVETNINNITDLAGAKAFLTKLARVVYWDIKNTGL